MQASDYPDDVARLVDVCHRFGERGWCSATSGNFSVRIDDAHCLITQSGRDKSRLVDEDLMICDMNGEALDAQCKPSAETPLHCRLYELDPSIGAVLHTHSVASTLLSKHGGKRLRISGLEMQKALAGMTTHADEVAVRIFANDQDMTALSEKLRDAWQAGDIRVPGFLIAGHGLYAWGRDLDEARRHVEGFEFLFECRWQESLAGLS